MSLTNQTAINWQQLTQALREQRCVLLLGPDVCCDFAATTPKPMTRELAMHLSQHIEEQDNTLPLIDNSKLSYVAAAYESSFVEEGFEDADNLYLGRARRKKAIKEFYQNIQDPQFSFYEQLARLPFHIIINTSHYDFFNKALADEDKLAQTHYFNYRKPEHNGRLRFEAPTKDKPLVYNLFGRIDNIESLVLTEADQIFFSENIVQKEATAALPSDLRALLLRKNQAQDEYIFLFMGFDFREWHLRILLHFLFKHDNNQQKYTAIALQKPEDIHPLTHFLYEKHFSVDFRQLPPSDFLDTLETELALAPPPPPLQPVAQGGKRLFIMNHPNEDKQREELEIALAMLKRNKVISEIQSGADITHGVVAEEMQQFITAADVVVLIVTKQFLADDKLYSDYLPLVLERHHAGEARVIPVIMSSCLWENSDVDISTILPMGGTPVNMKDDRDKTLKDVTNGIEAIIKRFWNVT